VLQILQTVMRVQTTYNITSTKFLFIGEFIVPQINILCNLLCVAKENSTFDKSSFIIY
jgi:hypothetical protein